MKLTKLKVGCLKWANCSMAWQYRSLKHKLEGWRGDSVVKIICCSEDPSSAPATISSSQTPVPPIPDYPMALISAGSYTRAYNFKQSELIFKRKLSQYRNIRNENRKETIVAAENKKVIQKTQEEVHSNESKNINGAIFRKTELCKEGTKSQIQ